jgi:hypothetical protein
MLFHLKIFQTPLYKKWHFPDLPIQKNGIFETPLYKPNGLFETPIYKKWPFRDLLFKKI